MKLKKHIKDKITEILITLFLYIIILLLLIAFKTKTELILALTLIYLLTILSFILIPYFRKKTFYNKLEKNIKELDKAYLVLETIKEPTFYEGKIITNLLYEINKSMIENVNTFEKITKDFKEYIEIWIHEIKIPLSSLTLKAHNQKNEFSKNTINQIKKIDDYLEQILYYIRSENANKDYYINKINLKKIINNVALKNQTYLLEHNINLIVKNINLEIYTDAKWLEFVLNQIINNSIKYKDNKKESYIKVFGKEEKNTIKLMIEDNGIGIPSTDIQKVFEKTFTGKNGRENSYSTGMGLYIVKNLINKLGHKIEITSEENKFTKVKITFSKNEFYEVVK